MSQSACAIRANGKYLERYIKKGIRLVGRVLTISDGQFQFETSDGMIITVTTNNMIEFDEGSILEVICIVTSTEQVAGKIFTPFNHDFDLSTYDGMINLAHQHPEMYGTA